MEQNDQKKILWPFFLQIPLLVLIPFFIWYSKTPTNVLNSSLWWKLLQTVGIGGSIILFWVGIPVGVLGLKNAKRTQGLCIPTRIMAVITFAAGAFFWLALLAGIIAVLFFGANH